MGTEGNNQTERKYFSHFNDNKSKYRILQSKGHKTDPVGVINELIMSVKKEELNIQEGDMAIAFIDVDFLEVHHKQLIEARKLALKHGIKMYLSNPCFEIWFLSHFRYSTKQYYSNDEVVHDLKEYIPGYAKNLDVFPVLKDRTETAIENSKKLETYHESIISQNFMDRNPSTEVFQFVELLSNEYNKH